MTIVLMMDNIKYLKVHTNYSDSESSSGGKSDFDEEYERFKPPEKDVENCQTVTIAAEPSCSITNALSYSSAVKSGLNEASAPKEVKSEQKVVTYDDILNNLSAKTKSKTKKQKKGANASKTETSKKEISSKSESTSEASFENLDSGVGIYAPDPDAYSVFAEIFDPIIDDYHKGFKKHDTHPHTNWGNINMLSNVDPKGEYVVSTRVRCARSLEGYPFSAMLSEEQYREIEEKMTLSLMMLMGELKGKFYPLATMSDKEKQQLIDDHFLFKEGDRFLQSAKACRFWPTGRGIFHNDMKTFLVWINEEDHVRIISMQEGGDVQQVYRRMVDGVRQLEKSHKFATSERFGNLTFCPTNLGTAIRASVHIRVPKLAENMDLFEEIAGKYNLQVRGTRGEHTEAEGGIYDISNKRRLGLTEFDAVLEMHNGILAIIEKENSL